MRHILLSLVMLFCLGNTAQAEGVPVPPLQQRVTDLSNTLNVEQKSHIESVLSDLEKTEGSQVAILIVATTLPEAIEDYSIRVVEKWKLGRKNTDDGVLLLIAKNDRKIRIEVGYGLEGAITDLSAGRIIKEYITPEFRRGRFYQGILAGIGQIANLIKGEPLPVPTTSQGETSNSLDTLYVVSLLGSILLLRFLEPIVGRLISSLLSGLIGAAALWLLTQNLSLAIFVGVVTFISRLLSSDERSSYRNRGGYGGGFGGGGSSGGGGFSGGGGGFGGGGASGGW